MTSDGKLSQVSLPLPIALPWFNLAKKGSFFCPHGCHSAKGQVLNSPTGKVRMLHCASFSFFQLSHNLKITLTFRFSLRICQFEGGKKITKISSQSLTFGQLNHKCLPEILIPVFLTSLCSCTLFYPFPRFCSPSLFANENK